LPNGATPLPERTEAKRTGSHCHKDTHTHTHTHTHTQADSIGRLVRISKINKYEHVM